MVELDQYLRAKSERLFEFCIRRDDHIGLNLYKLISIVRNINVTTTTKLYTAKLFTIKSNTQSNVNSPSFMSEKMR